ncbi:MAG TPA: hypothetical protein VGE07_15310 [Herpetosiphonaceae bacterium]
MKHPRPLRFLFAPVLSGVLSLWPPAARPAAACSPPAVTSWFSETLSAGSSALPSGVLLRSESPWTLVLTNTTAVPLYVIGSDERGSYPPLDVPLPAGRGAIFRLQGGQAHEWSWRGDLPESGAPVMEWLQEPDYRRTDALEIKLGDDQLYTDSYDILAEFPSANRIGDNRPSDAALPAPRPVALTLVYGGQSLTVPLTVSYRLNPSYRADSVAVQEGFSGCKGSAMLSILIIGGGLVVFLVVLWALVTVVRWVASAPEERQ